MSARIRHLVMAKALYEADGKPIIALCGAQWVPRHKNGNIECGDCTKEYEKFAPSPRNSNRKKDYD